jgi:hypothetical protein
MTYLGLRQRRGEHGSKHRGLPRTAYNVSIGRGETMVQVFTVSHKVFKSNDHFCKHIPVSDSIHHVRKGKQQQPDEQNHMPTNARW